MAEAGFSQDEFMCPVCLDLGYSKSCITGCLDQEDEKKVYSCPKCRENSNSRPSLSKNPILAGMVEKLNKPKRPADCNAGAGDVQCDVCTGRKYKAIKTCLECKKSYCETHFGHHEEFHCRKPHKVTDATGRLHDRICRKHEKELEIFCITDQQYICGICKDYEHKNHKTASTTAQRTEKQRFQSLSAPPESTDVSCSFLPFDDLTKSVHQLKVKQEDLSKEEIKVSVRGKQNKPLLKEPLKDKDMNTVPKTRRDFQKYSHQFTVDLNTVNKYLRLSESNRVISNVGFYTAQSYPDHPDRFDRWYQVLSRESICGCCYWEIEWCRHVHISVSYKSISRKGKGNKSVFGHNDQSWSLVCSPSRFSFIHNNIRTDLAVKPISNKTGVYVDHSSGILYYYSISDTDTMSLILAVHTTFTQPLYPGFGFYSQSAVKM